MRKRKPQNTGITARLIGIEELRDYTNLGRNAAMKLGAMAGARVNVGKRIMYDRKKVDAYIDTIVE